MQRSAILFLILLRVAIGWHFFYEGALKVRSVLIGPTVTNRPFSSAGYFREAPGPLGQAYRAKMGNPDADALAHLVVRPLAGNNDPASDRPQQRMPPALKNDWDAYLQRFLAHYSIDRKLQQREQAEAKLDQAKVRIVEWLTYTPGKAVDKEKDPKYPLYTSEQTHIYSTGEVKRRMSMAERIDEYQAKLADIRDAGQKMWVMGKDVEGSRLQTMKVDAARMRTSLLKDLDEQTNEMKKSLDSVLTPKQKGLEPEFSALLAGNIVGSRSDSILTSIVIVGCAVDPSLPSPYGGEVDPVKAPQGGRLVDWIDLLTRWGLVAIGACLMLGLLTRTSAWLGAGFLLLTYLTVPPWPWLPSPPLSEGSYLFVNKNLIEMLALCVLATTYSGRWFGVDGMMHSCWCWMTGKQPTQ